MIKLYCSTFFFLLSHLILSQVSTQWVTSFEGDDYDELKNMTYTAEGDILVSCQYEGMIKVGDDTYNVESFSISTLIIKLNEDGQVIWSRDLHASAFAEVTIFKILPDPSGDFYVIGSVFGDEIDMDPGSATSYVSAGEGDNIVVGKYDKDGNYIWANSYRFSATSDERGLDMDIDDNGNLYMVGYFDVSSNNNDDNMFLISLDNQGEARWAYTALPTGRVDGFNSVAIKNNHIYVVGDFRGRGDFDNTEEGELILESTPDESSTVIAKFDLTGAMVWIKQLKGEGSVTGRSIIVNNNDEIYIGGSYGENIDFDPDEGTNIQDGFISEPFVLKLNSDGSFNWVWTYEGTQVRRVILADDGGVYFGGDGSTTFFGQLSNEGDVVFVTDLEYKNSPNSSNADLQGLVYDGNNGLAIGVDYFFGFQYDPDEQIVIESTGQSDIAIAKYNLQSTSTKDVEENIIITHYPNPITNTLNVQWPELEVREIQVIDLNGHAIEKRPVAKNTVGIEMPFPYPAGIYIIQLNGETFSKSLKVTKF